MGDLIRTFAATGSTNDDMLAMACAGAEEGLWLRAERQTGGKGRQGRAWVSPSGNIYASTLVRLRPGDPPARSEMPRPIIQVVVSAQVMLHDLGV